MSSLLCRFERVVHSLLTSRVVLHIRAQANRDRGFSADLIATGQLSELRIRVPTTIGAPELTWVGGDDDIHH